MAVLCALVPRALLLYLSATQPTHLQLSHYSYSECPTSFSTTRLTSYLRLEHVCRLLAVFCLLYAFVNILGPGDIANLPGQHSNCPTAPTALLQSCALEQVDQPTVREPQGAVALYCDSLEGGVATAALFR
jgi:hypothetical protein